MKAVLNKARFALEKRFAERKTNVLILVMLDSATHFVLARRKICMRRLTRPVWEAEFQCSRATFRMAEGSVSLKYKYLNG